MRIYKNGSDIVEISYDDHDTVNQSTAFLITVRPDGYNYSYLIPYAESEQDAVSKFMLSVRRMIEFQDLMLTAEHKQEENFEVPVSTFEVQGKSYKLKTLKKRFVQNNKRIDKTSQLLADAIEKNDNPASVQLSFLLQKLSERGELLREAVRKASDIKQTRIVKESVRNVWLRKQFEIIKAYEQGKVSAERLPAHRVIPVAYFDDSRGEIGHITSCYLLPVTGELPSWARDVPR